MIDQWLDSNHADENLELEFYDFQTPEMENAPETINGLGDAIDQANE